MAKRLFRQVCLKYHRAPHEKKNTEKSRPANQTGDNPDQAWEGAALAAAVFPDEYEMPPTFISTICFSSHAACNQLGEELNART
jgi:hypothetical protein